MSTVPEFDALGVKELKFRHSKYSQDQMANPWMGISDKVEEGKLWMIIPGVHLLAPDGDGVVRAVVYADQAMISGKLGIGCINGGQYETKEQLYVKGAVRIDGPLVVSGEIKQLAGGFQIDHPLDPEHKYLSHSCVESPDMKNVYDGVIELDASGEAWVELPAWFETLNREFRYQLTAIGAAAPNLHVAVEMSGNRFKIAGGLPDMKVSWQVTGIRQDTFAQEHPLPVEAEKLP